MRLTSSWCRVENKEIISKLFIYFNYSCFIAAPVAVIRGREDSDNLLFMTPVIALKVC